MKKFLLTAAVALGLALPQAAEAGGYYKYRYYGYGNGAAVAAGVLGGVLLGAALVRPRYYGYYGYYGPPRVYYYGPPPPPVYYVPPPRVYYAPPPPVSCYKDKVYRYLPDGSVQWGTRTRCY